MTAAAGKDYFGNLGIPYLIEGEGLTINAQHDVTASGTFEGTGRFVKQGPAKFTLTGFYASAGDFVLEAGTLAFGVTVQIDHNVHVIAADNTTIQAVLTADGIPGLSSTAFVPSAGTTGRVNIVLDAQILPESGVRYLLFSGGGSPETLARIAVPDGYQLETDDEGRIYVKMAPKTHVWTGLASSDNDWTTGENWNTLCTPVSFDSLLFQGEGGMTRPNLNAGVALQSVDFASGAWTLAAASQVVAQTVNVAAGATVTLGMTNQLSSTAGEVAISGVLDLGGHAQDFTVAHTFSDSQDVLKNGCEIRNGTLNLSFPGWWTMAHTAFTVGPNATLITWPDRATGTQGEWNFQNGAYLTIDGGAVVLQDLRDSGTGYYLGCDNATTATVRIVNGGLLYDRYKFFRVGYNGGGTGVLSVDHGTVNIADGAEELRVASSDKSGLGHGVLSLTNATLRAKAIRFAETVDNGRAQVTLKDSAVTVERVYRSKTLAADSFFHVDGTTFTTVVANVDYFGDLGLPYEIGENGLMLNAQHDVRAAGELTGTGSLVKTGPGTLMVNGRYFAGPIEVREGGFGFGAQSVATGARVKMAGGTALHLVFSTLGIGGSPEIDLDIDETTEGDVALVIDFQNAPLYNTEYPLFRSISDAALARLVTNGVQTRRDASGMFYFKVVPTAHRWTGAGTTNTWQTAANWDSNKTPVRYDSMLFAGEGGTSVYDLTAYDEPEAVMFESGVWTIDVTNATLAASKSFTIATGAELYLKNAGTNPLPTGFEVLAIGGVLDLGGASQTVNTRTTGQGVGVFRTGGELRNGTLTIIEPSTGNTVDWWFFNNGVDFTIGTGATVIFPKQTDQRGQINFSNTHLKIDGGELQALNGRNTGAYVGNAGPAVIEVVNGGRFIHPNTFISLGVSNDGKGEGSMIGDHAEVDLGGQNLFMGCNNQMRSCLALTNSTFKCGAIAFAKASNNAPGPQIVEFVNTVATVDRFVANKVHASSSVTFDGTTFVSANSAPFPVLGIPYTLIGGGLTVMVPDAAENAATLVLGGVFAGAGDLRFVYEGETVAKSVTLDGTAEALTGRIVVDGVLFTAVEKTLGGGLVARAGSTLDVASSVFKGPVTIEAGVSFAGLDLTSEDERPVTLVKARGKIESPLLNQREPNRRKRYFVGRKDGMYALQYGVPPAFTLFVR